MDETEYRSLLKLTFDKIEHALMDVDPDLVETTSQFGVLTLVFGDQSKLILSAQPSVRQLWLAYAAKGVAHHFNYDDAQKKWLDDKGKGLEVVSYLKTILSQQTGLNVLIPE